MGKIEDSLMAKTKSENLEYIDTLREILEARRDDGDRTDYIAKNKSEAKKFSFFRYIKSKHTKTGRFGARQAEEKNDSILALDKDGEKTDKSYFDPFSLKIIIPKREDEAKKDAPQNEMDEDEDEDYDNPEENFEEKERNTQNELYEDFVSRVDEQIELSVVVLHGACPHAGGVGVLAVEQVVAVVVGQLQQGLCTIFPVHHVLRLHDGGSREVVHGGRHHIVGVTNADDVGVGHIGADDGVLVLGTPVADWGADKVGQGVVYLCPFGIPVHAGLAAGLFQTAEGRHHVATAQQLVDIDEAARAGEGHGDVSVVVVYGLVDRTPHRCAACGPCAVVRLHPDAVLVVVASAWLVGAPVNLGDDDGVGV